MNVKKLMLPAAALLLLSQALYARRPEVRHEDILVPKGETLRGDVATDRSLTVDGKLDGAATAVGGASVTINGELTGNLVSMGGVVTIPGLVDGDVSSIGGPVRVSGRVAGNVSAVGGGVALIGAGEVDGDISALGGGVQKDDGARHKGSVNSYSADALRDTLTHTMRTVRYSVRYGGDMERDRHGPWLVGGLVGAGIFVLFSMLATGVVLLMLPAIFFPKNVENSAAAISGDMWRACGIGALTVVGFFPGMVMMLVSILGIPLIPFVLMLAAAAAVLGLSAFSALLQDRFFTGIKKAGPLSLTGKVAAGYAIMAGLLFFGKVIPLIGGLLSLIGLMLLAFGTMVGLGAAWMTRMGNRTFVPVAPAQPVPPAPAPAPQEPPQPPAAQP
ncbi:MAG: polymer-forming cytoskeletal protein [Elusimicrobia bacterium]|nr:polymer-forming cytoskeletal protein [Elusimicrobiota bacterium]